MSGEWDPRDPRDAAALEFCYGNGRAIPISVFLGRVVEPGEPQWLPEDTRAALVWQEYEKSLCSGCKRPRDETFALEMDDHYDVVPVVCHACAARDSKASKRLRENEGRPLFGEFYIVKPEETDDAAITVAARS